MNEHQVDKLIEEIKYFKYDLAGAINSCAIMLSSAQRDLEDIAKSLKRLVEFIDKETTP